MWDQWEVGRHTASQDLFERKFRIHVPSAAKALNHNPNAWCREICCDFISRPETCHTKNPSKRFITSQQSESEFDQKFKLISFWTSAWGSKDWEICRWPCRPVQGYSGSRWQKGRNPPVLQKAMGACHAFVTLCRWYFFPFFVTHSDHGTKSALAYVKWSESATIACFGSVALQRRVAASESEHKSISLKALEGCKTHQIYTTTDGECACTEMLVFLKPRRSTMLPISKKQAGWACAAWLIMSCCCTLDVVLYSELFLLPFEMMPQYLLFWKHSQRRSLTFFLLTDWARLDGVLHHPRLGHRDLAPCHVFGWFWLFHVI